MSAERSAGRARARRLGLAAGPLLASLAWIALPESYAGTDGEAVAFPAAGRATAALAVWMAVWWLTEAIEVYATALLPLLLLPLLGARSMREAAAPYGHELIFLFLGGFLLALSMERWGLPRRFALVALGLVGERPARVIGGFMAVTALVSMWVSNTATAIIMLPVARSVIDRVEATAGGVEHGEPGGRRTFGVALLLGVAYAASIGGIATPIGTPPNLFLLSYLSESLGREVSFVRWMGVGLPLVLVFLPITWWLLTRVLHPVHGVRIPGGGLARRSLAELGPMSRPERIAFAAFLTAAALWITRPLLGELALFGSRPFAGLTDTGIAILVALALFAAPAGARAGGGPVLDWATAVRVPWGILLLFGGGLSLAAAMSANGVGELLGAQVGTLAGVPSPLLVLGVVTLVIFLTELTSNTATTATLLPILGGLAPGLGIDPLLLVVPAAIAASCAFMMPVATPPNAVVFGSGGVGIPEMSRAGLWLNLIGAAIVTALAYVVALPLLAGV